MLPSAGGQITAMPRQDIGANRLNDQVVGDSRSPKIAGTRGLRLTGGKGRRSILPSAIPEPVARHGDEARLAASTGRSIPHGSGQQVSSCHTTLARSPVFTPGAILTLPFGVLPEPLLEVALDRGPWRIGEVR